MCDGQIVGLNTGVCEPNLGALGEICSPKNLRWRGEVLSHNNNAGWACCHCVLISLPVWCTFTFTQVVRHPGTPPSCYAWLRANGNYSTSFITLHVNRVRYRVITNKMRMSTKFKQTWYEHVARMGEMRNPHRILVEKLLAKTLLVRYGRSRKIKMTLDIQDMAQWTEFNWLSECSIAGFL